MSVTIKLGPGDKIWDWYMILHYSPEYLTPMLTLGLHSYRSPNLVLVLKMWENLESNLPEVVFPWRYTSCRLCIAISSWLVTELYSKSCLEASKQESGFPFHLCQVRRKVRKSGGASSNGVDILFSPDWNRVTWPAKIGGEGAAAAPLPPSVFTALFHLCCSTTANLVVFLPFIFGLVYQFGFGFVLF